LLRKDLLPEGPEAEEKLRVLKERSRSGGLAVRENYPDPDGGGRLILEDLGKVIERRFGPVVPMDPLDREALEHEAIGESRLGVYIGRDGYFEDSMPRWRGRDLRSCWRGSRA
jgi:hypothetical protein